MGRIFFALLCVCLLVNDLQGQHTPFYYSFLQHTQNQLLYNPAYAGTSNKVNLHLRSMHVVQKSLVNGAWGSQLNHGYAAFDMPTARIRGAVGAYVAFNIPQQKDGRYYTLSAGTSYAYRWQVNQQHRVQFGASVNYRRSSIKDNISVFQANGEWDVIPYNRSISNQIDFGLGVWYQFKGLNTGVSVSHLGNLRINGRNDIYLHSYPAVVNAYAAYNFELPRKFHLELYAFGSSESMKFVSEGWGEVAQLSIGALADYNKAVFLGLSYNYQSIGGVTVGAQFKEKLKVMATYYRDIPPVNKVLMRQQNFEVSMTMQFQQKEKGGKKGKV